MKKLFGMAVAVALLMASGVQAAVQIQLKIDAWRDLSATPTIESVTVYTDSDALGDAMVFPGATRRSGGMGVIREVLVISTISSTVGFDLFIMSRTFTGTATNEAFAPVNGELNDSLLTTITVAGSDWTSLGTAAAYCRKTDVDFVYDLPAGQDDLHAQMVMNLGDESFAANSLVVILKVAWLD